jgi:hypothetical protein
MAGTQPDARPQGRCRDHARDGARLRMYQGNVPTDRRAIHPDLWHRTIYYSTRCMSESNTLKPFFAMRDASDSRSFGRGGLEAREDSAVIGPHRGGGGGIFVVMLLYQALPTSLTLEL